MVFEWLSNLVTTKAFEALKSSEQKLKNKDPLRDNELKRIVVKKKIRFWVGIT